MMRKNKRRNINKMKFIEFAEKHFEGEEEKAIECLAREACEEFELIKDVWEWYSLYLSLTSEQRKKYEIMHEKYKREDKYFLNKARILNELNPIEYKKARNFLGVSLGIITILCLIFCIPLFFILLMVDIPMAIAIFLRNRTFNALTNDDFYIIKLVCSHKNVKHGGSDVTDDSTYSIYFPEYKRYIVSEKEYEDTKCGEEFFLVVVNCNPKKIVTIFKADLYEVSDEFYLSGDKFLPRK